MPDTRRLLIDLIALTPDNTAGDFSNQDMRDALVTALWHLKRYAGNISGAASYNYGANGGIADLTLTANVTSFSVTNMLTGDRLTLAFIQGGAGGFTIAGITGILFEGGTPPTLSTTPGHRDIFNLYFDGTQLVEHTVPAMDVG